VTVRRWFSAISKDGLGAATAAKSYRLLRTIMGRAVTEGLIARNPVNVERAGKENAAERPTLTIAQVYALADAVGPRFRPLVVLAAFSGLRLGELRGLRQGNLDLAGRTVRVVEQIQEGGQWVGRNVTAPKTAAGLRTVAIPEAVIAELEAHLTTVEYRGADDFVFPGYERGGAHVRQVSGIPFS
jgi:integrase